MKITPTAIADVKLIKQKVFNDDRGFFLELYQARRYMEAGVSSDFVQDSLSNSRQGVLRGLHYQIKQAQGKLIYVVSGEIYDVAVDLRKSSEYFGNWVGVILSSMNKSQLWIPPGFAHGFYVISDWATVIYKVTDFYYPEWDRILIWNDAQVGIVWPLLDGKPPTLSDKDAKGKSLSEADLYD